MAGIQALSPSSSPSFVLSTSKKKSTSPAIPIAENQVTSKTSSENGYPVSVLFSQAAIGTYICHSADNFTKYSINAWAATMLAEKHGASPSRIWTILGTQEAIGVVSRLIVGMLFSSSKKDNTSLRPFSSRGWTSCIAFVIQSIAIGSAFAAFNTFQASIMFVVSAVAVGAHSVGFRPIYLEASPDHAGSISGFGNTIASFASAIGPVIVVTGNEAATVPLKDKNWSRVGLWMGVVNMVAALASLKIATAVPRPISNKNTGIFRKYSRS